jgi:hypothetical protein
MLTPGSSMSTEEAIANKLSICNSGNVIGNHVPQIAEQISHDVSREVSPSYTSSHLQDDIERQLH